MSFCSDVMLLSDRTHIFPKVFFKYFGEKGYIGAVGLEGSQCNLQRLDMIALLSVILEIVLFCGQSETAN